jgi:hypothetical protein
MSNHRGFFLAGAVPVFFFERSHHMARTPNGTIASIATAFAAGLAFNAASNAAETVLTVTAGTLVAGDLVEVTSTWSKISNRIFRVKVATATAITLEDCDTSNTTLYPAGGGTGTLRKVTTWMPMSQKLTVASSGGDPKTVNFTYVETGDEQTVFDGFGATQYTIDLDADTVGSPLYKQLKTLTDTNAISALRLAAPNGSVVLLSCAMALNENPSMSSGAVMANRLTFFGRGRTVRYATTPA